MTQNAFDKMDADKNLVSDLNKAQSFEDLRALLENSVERSGIAHRNEQTGRFEAVDPAKRQAAEAAAAAAANQPSEFTRRVTIAGVDFDVTASSAEEFERKIADAEVVAKATAAAAANLQQPIEESDVARAARQVEIDLQFKRGEITAAEYIQQSGAVEQFLADRGIDVNALAQTVETHTNESYAAEWGVAVQEFLQSEAGRTWPGGAKNLALAQQAIFAMGLEDEPSAETIAKVWKQMQEAGTYFPQNEQDEFILKEAQKASPRELIEAFKESQMDNSGSPEKANAAFIEAFRNGRSSSLFGK